MTQKDQLKVMRAGFTIIRADEHNLQLKFKDRNNLHWKILRSGFSSKSALQREKKEFLKMNLFIED
ncbi:hypothetical protein EG349_10205 [Chryseobacterium shandongense]|uniref:Uncharacterized protein n=2 Tax=Chryseobacterium TaxID=59732 RepID=A0AAD0YA57_9FLAO|nr:MULTISPECIES: hypothetical protein [Chryseobacterium]AZA87131.1 hypothetical protein EG349_10205 [Chryseobacterium shandongense]AZA95560.1 hypothetical protein EG353_08280 [Chryseobacterium shandongense]MEC3876158.1 hypothetical protein [Chryseobacterium sp. T9W2-O]